MNPDKADQILTVLQRVERKIDTHGEVLSRHVIEDDIVHCELRRKQRGFVGGFTAALVAVGAGFAYVFRRIIGH